MLRKAGLPAQAADAGKMISMLDRDHDGVISYQEFCRFCCLLPSAQVQQIIALLFEQNRLCFYRKDILIAYMLAALFREFQVILVDLLRLPAPISAKSKTCSQIP